MSGFKTECVQGVRRTQSGPVRTETPNSVNEPKLKVRFGGEERIRPRRVNFDFSTDPFENARLTGGLYLTQVRSFFAAFFRPSKARVSATSLRPKIY